MTNETKREGNCCDSNLSIRKVAFIRFVRNVYEPIEQNDDSSKSNGDNAHTKTKQRQSNNNNNTHKFDLESFIDQYKICTTS